VSGLQYRVFSITVRGQIKLALVALLLGNLPADAQFLRCEGTERGLFEQKPRPQNL
jgi:hypothetical protein